MTSPKASHSSSAVLVADVGGTHARFGLFEDGRVRGVRILRCADCESLAAAVRCYLEGEEEPAPRQAVVAIAAPIEGDQIRMTNHVWSFSIEALRRDLGLDRLEVINDYAALALAVPALGASDCWEIKPGEAAPRQPIAVLGPGTGLGVAALVPSGDGWVPLTSEGGHRDLAAASEREWQVVRTLAERFGHVSVERVLSGPGLVNLYETVMRLSGEEPRSLSPRAIEAGARQRSSPAAIEALALFSGWLGAVAGDVALTFGARGGVYLGGGILPKLGNVFDVDRFRERFLAKGGFRDYLRPIPVRVITRADAALLGAGHALAVARGRR